MLFKPMFCLLSLVTAVPAFAQINKGQWMTGGTGAYSHSSSDNENSGVKNSSKSTTLGVSVDGAYFFADRFCGGLRPAVTFSDRRQETTVPPTGYYLSKAKSTAYILAPFARYYFLAVGRKINILADLGYAYSYNKQITETTQTVLNGVGFPFPISTNTIKPM